MTREQLEKLVQSRTKIMTIWTQTDVNMTAEGKKKFPGLKKFSRVNGVTGHRYENVLSRFNEKNGLPESTPQQRRWGQRDGNLVRHNGKTYLPIRIIRAKSNFMIGDKEIPYDDVKEFLRKKDGPPVADYNLENIVGVTVNGETSTIED